MNGPLGDDELWVVSCSTTDLDDSRVATACRALLAEDETARLDRFLNSGHKPQFLAGHALIRLLLSAAAPGVDPAAWRLAATPHGRPDIADPEAHRDLRFNMSHTQGLVACACIRGRAVGVDVERINPAFAHRAVADQFFSAEEAAALRALPDDEARVQRFFTYWTIKESYLKARGKGLALPLGAFTVHLGPAAAEATIAFDGQRIVDDTGRWIVRHRSVMADHLLATCVERVGRDPTERREHLRLTVTPEGRAALTGSG